MEESADNFQVLSEADGSVASPADSSDDPSLFVQEDGLVHIAAFDFDGTCISGNSPVLLVRRLMKLGMLEKSVLARIMLWGIAYKLRLPQNESWVRGLVFRAFAGKPGLARRCVPAGFLRLGRGVAVPRAGHGGTAKSKGAGPRCRACVGDLRTHRLPRDGVPSD